MPKILRATVAKVFQRPVQKNRATGETFGGDTRVQLIDEIPLENGSKQLELVTLTVPSGLKFTEGEVVDIPFRIVGKCSFVYDNQNSTAGRSSHGSKSV